MLFTITLHENRDFQRLYRSGACCPMHEVVLYAMPNHLPMNRLGITAGKKVGNAVKRNRAKRLIRAAYTAVEQAAPIGLDIVIVARAVLPDMRATDLTAALSGRGMRHLQGVSEGSIACGKSGNRTDTSKRKRSCGTSSQG